MAYEEARLFLARVVPWPTVLEPPEFFVNIHCPGEFTLPDGTKKKHYGGRACRTLDEAIRHIDYRVGATDIYVCMSGQSQGKPKTDKLGRAYWNAIRAAQNAVAHRCFYIDVDVKPGAYATIEEAMDAFVAFCTAVGLPPPTFVVASGSGGFHAHWVIDDPIPTSVWQPVADDLHGAILYHGLKADQQCTTNAAQILRVPNTFNWKHDPPKPVTLEHTGQVYTLSRIADVVLKYRQFNTTRTRTAAPVARPVDMKVNLGPISHLAGPVKDLVPNQQESLPSLLEVAKVCPFVRHAATTGGASYLQPLWWETAKIAFHVREGREALTIMADKYPKYDASENDELYARIVHERTPVDKYGWPQCQTIMGAGSPVCAKCSWWTSGQANGRSPFNFMAGSPLAPTTPVVTTTVTVAPLATDDKFDVEGHYRDEQLKIWRHPTTDDEGNVIPPQLVCPYPFRGLTPVHGDVPKVIFEIVVDQRGWISVEIEKADLSDNRGFGRVAGSQDLTLKDIQLRLMREMLVSFIQQLRDRKSIPSEPFGWTYENGEPAAFNYARRRFNCAGDTPAALADRVIQKRYEPTGTIEPWLRAMKLINDQKRQALDAIVACSFGSVFMEFTSEKALLVSAYSPDTAVQKTSAMRVSTAAWGHPTSARQTIDTEFSIASQLGHTHNIVLNWDEMRDADPKDVAKRNNLLFSLTQGQDRARLHRSSAHQDVRTWATMLVAASNSSLLSYAADTSKMSTASLYRVYEFLVPPRENSVGYSEDAQKIILGCEQNYGWAGLEFSRWCGSHALQAAEIVPETMHMIKKQIGGSESERFWIAGVACMILGAKIANHLKLAQFDEEALYSFLIKNIDTLRRRVEASDVGVNRSANIVGIVAQMLNKTDRRRFLFTDFMASTGPGRPTPVSLDMGLNADIRQLGSLVAHVATQTKILRVSRAALGQFCEMNQYRKDEIFRAITERLHAKLDNLTLGAGTKIKQAREKVFEFDLNRHTDLRDLLDL